MDILNRYIPSIFADRPKSMHDSSLDTTLNPLSLKFFFFLLNRLNPLDHHGRRRSAAVANGRNTILARLKLVQKRGEDTRAGATQRVAKGDGAAQGVNLGVLEPENLEE